MSDEVKVYTVKEYDFKTQQEFDLQTVPKSDFDAERNRADGLERNLELTKGNLKAADLALLNALNIKEELNARLTASESARKVAEARLEKARNIYGEKFVDKVVDKKYSVEAGTFYIKKQLDEYDKQLSTITAETIAREAAE